MMYVYELRPILGRLKQIHRCYHYARKALEDLMSRQDLPEKVREKFKLLDLPNISEFHRLDAAIDFIQEEIEKAKKEGA